MKLLVVLSVTLVVVSGQETEQEAIDRIFGPAGFLENYEEVTPPPLKSFAALMKCGEGTQKNQFVCVPYYNCDPKTNTVVEVPDVDGTNKIQIRMQDDEEPKCDHYLEVCCKLSGEIDNSTEVRTTPSTPVTEVPPVSTAPITSRPIPSSVTPTNTGTRRFNCGIRNPEGLDFNVISIGGTNEANFAEFPWMVAVLRKNPINDKLCICGGSLIGPRVILTGAHCVYNTLPDEIKVRAGEWDTQTQNERIPYQERNVQRIIMHNHFIKSTLYNDLALLILDKPFTKTDSIGTVCLPEQDQHFDSRECFATGWGKDRFGQQGRYAVVLKKVQLPLVQNAQCQKALRKTRLGPKFTLHRSFICAGGGRNVDTCTGDGGGPLVCPDPNNPGRYLQVGTVGWGVGCGENQVPGVYADVAGSRTWIDLALQELGIDSSSYTL